MLNPSDRAALQGLIPLAGALGAGTIFRGASNEKAKRELGWQPRHPSWRQGIAAEAPGIAV